jgi:hypothetical protein
VKTNQLKYYYFNAHKKSPFPGMRHKTKCATVTAHGSTTQALSHEEPDCHSACLKRKRFEREHL